MYLQSAMQVYFPNTNLDTAKYLLKISVTWSQSEQLNDIYGVPTQTKLDFVYNWQIEDIKTHKVYLKSSILRNSYYNIKSSVYATKNNHNRYLDLANKMVAKDIAFKVFSLLKTRKGNLAIKPSQWK